LSILLNLIFKINDDVIKMKKILILGSSGLIGCTLYKYLTSIKKISVEGTYNSNKLPFKYQKKFNFIKDDMDFFKKYDLIINCIGITKHNPSYSDINLVFNLNVRLPLMLNDLAKEKKINVIHISSDCVFSGNTGNYKEKDNDFAIDLYGQTKRIAENLMKNSLVIRTSTIGHEFFYKYGLLEWFLSNKDECVGFKNAYFNGLTTLELAKVIYKYFISKSYYPKLLLNVGSNRISKYDLLCKLNTVYDLNINIEKNYDFKIDRTLNISKFLNLTDYKLKTWYKMLLENKNYINNV